MLVPKLRDTTRVANRSCVSCICGLCWIRRWDRQATCSSFRARVDPDRRDSEVWDEDEGELRESKKQKEKFNESVLVQ